VDEREDTRSPRNRLYIQSDHDLDAEILERALPGYIGKDPDSTEVLEVTLRVTRAQIADRERVAVELPDGRETVIELHPSWEAGSRIRLGPSRAGPGPALFLVIEVIDEEES